MEMDDLPLCRSMEQFSGVEIPVSLTLKVPYTIRTLWCLQVIVLHVVFVF